MRRYFWIFLFPLILEAQTQQQRATFVPFPIGTPNTNGYGVGTLYSWIDTVWAKYVFVDGFKIGTMARLDSVTFKSEVYLRGDTSSVLASINRVNNLLTWYPLTSSLKSMAYADSNRVPFLDKANTFALRNTFTGGLTSLGYMPQLRSEYLPTEVTADSIPSGHYDFNMVLCQNVDGNLVLLYRSSTAHPGTLINDFSVICKRSSNDNGRHWSQADTIAKLTNRALDNVGGGITPSGRIVLFYTILNPTSLPVTLQDHGYITSNDFGTTWTSFTSLLPDSGAYASQASIINPSKDTLIVPFYKRIFGVSDTTWKVYALFSTDDGLTWGNPKDIISSKTIHYTESGLAYLGGSYIIGIIRADNGNTFRQVMSSDMGNTWGDSGWVAFDSWVLNDRNTAPNLVVSKINGQRVVDCYYGQRLDQKLRVVSALARDLITKGVNGWKITTRFDLAPMTTTLGGYPYASVDKFSRRALVAWSDEKSSHDNNIMFSTRTFNNFYFDSLSVYGGFINADSIRLNDVTIADQNRNLFNINSINTTTATIGSVINDLFITRVSGAPYLFFQQTGSGAQTAFFELDPGKILTTDAGLSIGGNFVGTGTGTFNASPFTIYNSGGGATLTLRGASKYFYVQHDNTNAAFATDQGSSGVKILFNMTMPDTTLKFSSTGAAIFSSSVTAHNTSSLDTLTLDKVIWRSNTTANIGPGNQGYEGTKHYFWGDEYLVRRAFDMTHGTVTADVVDTNSVAETTLYTVSQGANYPSVGKVVEIHLFGDYTTTGGGAKTLIFRVKRGTTVIDSAIVTTAAGGSTTQAWELRETFTYRVVGSSGNIQSAMLVRSENSDYKGSKNTTMNTTIDNSITVTVQLSTTGANYCYLRQGFTTTKQ